MKEKIKKFYKSELYIKIVYTIPALVSGGIAFLLFPVFSIQIIYAIFIKEELTYEDMIKEYRYNHRIYHKKDMEKMDRIIELMEEIDKKTKIPLTPH